MPNTYGELLRAQLENRIANPTPTTATKGRMWYRTDLSDMFVDTGSVAARFPWDLQSLSANPAASGVILLASQDKISWRNNANGADLPLSTDASDNLTYNSHAFLSSAGVVPVAAGGTNVTSYTAGDLLYATGSTTLAKLPIGTPNQLLRTNAGQTAPEWATITASYTAPTVQRFLSTGSTAGYMFTVTSASATAGATYTNNGNTYTVLGTIAASTTLFCSQAGAPQASGTLTKSGGTGDATIAFSTSLAGAIYTTPGSVLYLRVKLQGGGGGGGASSTNNGAVGLDSWFAATPVVQSIHGNGGLAASNGTASGGGTSIAGVTATIFSQTGGAGGAGQNPGALTENIGGGYGGNSFFGGAGVPNVSAAGTAAAANSGAGGGGGSQGSAITGGGGGAGGYCEVLISAPQAKYFYVVGTGGNGGSAGSQAGGNGAAGQLVVEEYYQ